MTLLVFSDSHGRIHQMNQAIKLHQPEVCIHLGDRASDLPEAISVRGNCDGYSNIPLERHFEFEGVRFMLCHGHSYGVKYTLERLLRAAKQAEAKLVLFGHTHQVYEKEHENILFLNPGSISLPRGTKGSYLKIQLENGKLYYEIFYI